MLKPTTVRVPDNFHNEVMKFIEEMGLDKSAYLRKILKKGFDIDRQERLLSEYQEGRLSAGEVCKILGISHWDFFILIKDKNMKLNVGLEDWLDSGKLTTD